MTLDEAIAILSDERKWRKHFTHGELLAMWSRFVTECERGYSMSIYEYENDRNVRGMIGALLALPELAESSEVREFRQAVENEDARFRGLLQEEVVIGAPGAFWWERGVPRQAGAELAADFDELYGIAVTVS
jgi:hypothetical protein